MTDPQLYADDTVAIYAADCFDMLADLDDNMVDAVVCDPPYGLGFMGKEWDSGKSFVERKAQKSNTFDHVGGNHNPSNPQDSARTRRVEGARYGDWCEKWAAECLRVLKPGGHLIAFGGTRTWHRLAAGVEDAGFEIRDSMAWLYGSGFPKSMDVSKAIDKTNGNPVAFREFARAYAAAVESSPMTHTDIDRHLGIKSSSCYWAREDHRGGMPPRHHWDAICALLGLSDTHTALYEEAERLDRTVTAPGGNTVLNPTQRVTNAGIPVTDAAKQWEGWGTALKPAFEPIVVARKPLGEKTVAANVLVHGTGALHIDACRVQYASEADMDQARVPQPIQRNDAHAVYQMGTGQGRNGEVFDPSKGRWPANVLLDDEMADALDEQSGTSKSSSRPRNNGHQSGVAFGAEKPNVTGGHDDSGGASRFFPVFRYQAKAPTKERPKVDGIAHPTVKPLALVEWLITLVTPQDPNAIVLDPFAGSGTTVEACIKLGVRCIASEREPTYLPLIIERINRAVPNNQEMPA